MNRFGIGDVDRQAVSVDPDQVGPEHFRFGFRQADDSCDALGPFFAAGGFEKSRLGADVVFMNCKRCLVGTNKHGDEVVVVVTDVESSVFMPSIELWGSGRLTTSACELHGNAATRTEIVEHV